MAEPIASLEEIQRRFFELIVAGEGVIPPGLLGASRRLDVYGDAYVSRLVDVLAADHPKLAAALGDGFADRIGEFVRARRPASFTVRDLGVPLAEYLESRTELAPWLADLARLERARVEVFDGPDAAPLTREALGEVPIEAFPDQRLGLVPSSELVSLRWAVDDVWAAIENDQPWQPPAACERAVLAWRRELQVVHRTLDVDEAALAPLVARQATIAELSERLCELEVEAPDERLVELLGRWIDAAAVVLVADSP
jgi:hypothetical protein